MLKKEGDADDGNLFPGMKPNGCIFDTKQTR
jgi:hypothetical protein